MNSKNKQQMDQLSREEIASYLTTKDARVKHAIEKKSGQHPLDDLALDGYVENAASIQDLKKLDKRFKPKKSFAPIGIACATICVAILCFFLFTDTSSDKVKTASGTVQEKTDVFLPDSIQKLALNPVKVRIDSKKFPKISTTKIIESPKKSGENDEVLIPVATIPVLKPEFPTEQFTIQKITAKEIYLNDLKLIDYRVYRKKTDIQVIGIQLTGTPADHETNPQQSQQNEESILDIPYHDYIKKTTSYFKNDDFKQVLARCQTILKVYPEDVNAQFYAGIAYYNLGEYQKAIDLFKMCLNASFNNFDEEAEWMLANAYLKNGESIKANAIYTLIKNRNGYYSKQVPK